MEEIIAFIKNNSFHLLEDDIKSHVIDIIKAPFLKTRSKITNDYKLKYGEFDQSAPIDALSPYLGLLDKIDEHREALNKHSGDINKFEERIVLPDTMKNMVDASKYCKKITETMDNTLRKIDEYCNTCHSYIWLMTDLLNNNALYGEIKDPSMSIEYHWEWTSPLELSVFDSYKATPKINSIEDEIAYISLIIQMMKIKAILIEDQKNFISLSIFRSMKGLTQTEDYVFCEHSKRLAKSLAGHHYQLKYLNKTFSEKVHDENSNTREGVFLYDHMKVITTFFSDITKIYCYSLQLRNLLLRNLSIGVDNSLFIQSTVKCLVSITGLISNRASKFNEKMKSIETELSLVIPFWHIYSVMLPFYESINKFFIALYMEYQKDEEHKTVDDVILLLIATLTNFPSPLLYRSYTKKIKSIKSFFFCDEYIKNYFPTMNTYHLLKYNSGTTPKTISEWIRIISSNISCTFDKSPFNIDNFNDWKKIYLQTDELVDIDELNANATVKKWIEIKMKNKPMSETPFKEEFYNFLQWIFETYLHDIVEFGPSHRLEDVKLDNFVKEYQFKQPNSLKYNKLIYDNCQLLIISILFEYLFKYSNSLSLDVLKSEKLYNRHCASLFHHVYTQRFNVNKKEMKFSFVDEKEFFKFSSDQCNEINSIDSIFLNEYNNGQITNPLLVIRPNHIDSELFTTVSTTKRAIKAITSFFDALEIHNKYRYLDELFKITKKNFDDSIEELMGNEIEETEEETLKINCFYLLSKYMMDNPIVIEENKIN